MVVAADGQFTDDEADALKFIETGLGEDSWQAAWDRAITSARNMEQAASLASTVHRVEAHLLIFSMAVMVAESDGLAPREKALLDLVAETWGLQQD